MISSLSKEEIIRLEKLFQEPQEFNPSDYNPLDSVEGDLHDTLQYAYDQNDQWN